ncbi:MAG: PTS system N-acetylgalactosamine-specific transporter subunit IIC [bacterium ADurb.Bin157]|jgi:mannose PTS system EIIC component|nr:MAG: PTS system N-acetylgalactosamine-specific transporter subunit IIC [bacterium ADurb.Bin157]
MQEHLIASLLIALIGGIVDLDSTATWQFMISQPIVAAPLTGLFLGNLYGEAAMGLKLGLMVGVILQLLWIEQLPLGMNVPPDAALASVLSVALGFIAGHSYETYSEREVCYTVALLLSVALGLLGRSLDMFVRRLNTGVDNWVNQKIEDNQFWAISLGHTLGGFFTFTKAFIFCFLIVWFGVEPLKYFTQTISLKHSSGFIVVQGLLPAVGFAVLASMCLKEKTELKYFVAAIMFFTVLPAKIWLGISAALIVMYKTRPRKKK